MRLDIHGSITVPWGLGTRQAFLMADWTWQSDEPEIVEDLALICRRKDVGPADGDPAYFLLAKAARHFNGTFEVEPRDPPPAGAMH